MISKFFAITETWLHDGIGDNQIVPPPYKIIRKDTGLRGGDVGIIFKTR